MKYFNRLPVVIGVAALFLVCCPVDSADLEVKPVGTLADREACTRADLYFVSWSVTTVVALHPRDVKGHPDLTLSLLNPFACQRFAAWLKLGELTTSPRGSSAGDARLVIDLMYADGQVHTYYASLFALMTEDAVSRRPIDLGFRQAICNLFIVPDKTGVKCTP